MLRNHSLLERFYWPTVNVHELYARITHWPTWVCARNHPYQWFVHKHLNVTFIKSVRLMKKDYQKKTPILKPTYDQKPFPLNFTNPIDKIYTIQAVQNQATLLNGDNNSLLHTVSVMCNQDSYYLFTIAGLEPATSLFILILLFFFPLCK